MPTESRGSSMIICTSKHFFLNHPTLSVFSISIIKWIKVGAGGGGEVKKKSSKCVLFSNALCNCHLATEKLHLNFAMKAMLSGDLRQFKSYMKVRCLIKIARQSHNKSWKLSLCEPFYGLEIVSVCLFNSLFYDFWWLHLEKSNKLC